MLRFALVTVVLAAPSLAIAMDDYTDGHADIGIVFEGGELEFVVESEGTAVIGGVPNVPAGTEFDPADINIVVSNNAVAPRPAGAVWDTVGNNAGDPTWIIPENDPGLGLDIPWLGVATEEIPLNTFVNDEITLTFEGATGPGTVTFWSSGPNFIFANSGDSLVIPAENEAHYSIGFTAPGVYQVNFSAQGQLIGGPLATATGTYNFTVVPEPTAITLLTIGAVALLRRR